MSIRSLIVDDEPLAIRVIETHLQQISEIELIATFQNPVSAFHFMKENTVDLIFLDIEMPLLTGIELIKSIEHPPKVIFTTAYRNYAVESYELDVVDYLVKPISFMRLFKAVNKYQSLTKTPTIEKRLEDENISDDHLYVNSNKRYVKIPFNEILFVESKKDYIQIHLEDKRVVTKTTIGNFKEKLPNQFLRVHRSFIVNTKKVTAFTALDIEIGPTEIPIGASYKSEVVAFFKK